MNELDMGNKITHKSLFEDFIVFEKENDLLNLKIKDIPVWEFIRVGVFTQIKEQLTTKNTNIHEIKFKKSFRVIYEFIMNILFYNPFFISKQKQYLILNHPRKKIDEGYYIDIYTDPWLSVLNDNYYVFEGFVNINFAHYKPTKTKNLYYLDVLQLPSHLIRFLPVSVKFSGAELQIIEEIENKIKNRWSIQNFGLKNKIEYTIKRLKFVKPGINRLLKKTNPSKIINVVSYSFINQAFTYYAKNRNIPVFELQHGTVGKYHIAYNIGTNELNASETFPDYFLAWGENWVKNARMPIAWGKIKIIGFPYFETFKLMDYKNRDLKQILILSQYRNDIADFAIQIAEKLPEHKIVYKAHPSEYLTIDNLLARFKYIPNIQIVANDIIHLYELFSQSNFVIGVNSTALIEAIAFCPNIYILKLPGWEYFEDLKENDSLKFIKNADEAKSIIQKIKKNISLSNDLNYFEKSSLKEIEKFISSNRN
jgi:hypothetical protein